jgi:chromosome segregation ATPase
MMIETIQSSVLSSDTETQLKPVHGFLAHYRVCSNWKLIPAIALTAICATGIVCAFLVWHNPYLSLPFGAGCILSLYLVYQGYHYSQLKNFQQNNQEFSRTLADTQRVQENLKEETKKYHKENESLKLEMDSLKSTAENLNLQISKLNEEKKNLQNNIEELQKSLHEFKKNHHSFKETIESLEKTKNVHHLQIQAIHSAFADVEKTAIGTQSEFERVVKNLSNVVSQFIEENEALKRNSLFQETASILTEIIAYLPTMVLKVKELKEQYLNNEKRIQEQMNQMAALRKALRDYSANRGSKQEDCNHLSQKVIQQNTQEIQNVKENFQNFLNELSHDLTHYKKENQELNQYLLKFEM